MAAAQARAHRAYIRATRSPQAITGLRALTKQYCERYENDSVAWAYDVARVGDVEFRGAKGLDPKQAEILAATDTHPLTAVAGAKGVGKEFLASLVATKFVATYPFARVPCASVTGGQMRGALWPEIQMRIAASPVLRQLLEWTPTQVVARGVDAHGLPLGPQWRIYLTAAAARQSEGGGGHAEAESGQGVHSENLLLIITEASGWGYAVWRAKLDTLTGSNNRAFVIGNPVRPDGPFFDLYHKPLIMQHWRRFHIAANESRAVDPGSLARMIDAYGETSSYVQANGFGQFPTAGSERSIFSHAEVVAAFERDVDDDPLGRLQIGCDVARFGFDRSVVHTRRGLRSLDEAWMPYAQTNETALLCVTEAWRWWRRPHDQPRRMDRFRSIAEADGMLAGEEFAGVREHVTIVVDDSGVGGGVTDDLKTWGWRVVPMNNGWSAKQPQFYYNRGAELWMVDAKVAIKSCHLPYSDELLAQLTQREYQFTGKKQQRALTSKKDMRAMGTSSPDHADAFVLAYADVDVVNFAQERNLVRVVGRRA